MATKGNCKLITIFMFRDQQQMHANTHVLELHTKQQLVQSSTWYKYCCLFSHHGTSIVACLVIMVQVLLLVQSSWYKYCCLFSHHGTSIVVCLVIHMVQVLLFVQSNTCHRGITTYTFLCLLETSQFGCIIKCSSRHLDYSDL